MENQSFQGRDKISFWLRRVVPYFYVMSITDPKIQWVILRLRMCGSLEEEPRHVCVCVHT